MKHLNPPIAAPHCLISHKVLRFAFLIMLPLVLLASLIVSSSARRNEKGVRGVKAVAGDLQRLSNPGNSLKPGYNPFVPQAAAETIDTFQQDCTTQNSSFTTGDTVCAHAGGTLFGERRIYWVNPDRNVVQVDTVSSSSRNSTRVVSQVGTWRVYLVDAADGSARAVATFSVSDPQAPSVDLAVVKVNSGEEFDTGNPVTYTIAVTNNGPDTATSVELTDPVPTGLTYISSSQDAGPAFTRTQDTPVTTWTIASLAPGAAAEFTFTYQVVAATGAVVTNSVNVTNTAAELHSENNTATISNTVANNGGGATCSLDCPNDVVVTATTHGVGGGAVVDYAAPEASGTCGTVTMSQASHTFFPTGSTTVTATAGTASCSFQVIVIDSPAPTISCPSNISVSTITGSGDASAFVPGPGGPSDPGTPTATGNNVTITGGRSDGQALTAAYAIGVTHITWTATECNDSPQCSDPFARSASCTQTITVTSADIPTIACPSNKTFAADGDCQKTLTAGDIGTPTVGGLSPTVVASRSDGKALTDPFAVGVTVITWTASNNLGSASCSQTITITASSDTTPPTLTIPPDVNATTSTCSALLDDELGVATATDSGACSSSSSVSIARTGVPRVPCPIPGDPGRTCESFVFPVGTTDVTYTATDAAGNVSTGVQHVTVTDNSPPVFVTVPGNVGPVNNDAGLCGAFVSDATLGTATVSDNCDTTVIRSGVPAGNIFPVGQTTITYRAKADLSVFVTQTVTVVDSSPPTFTSVPAAVTAYTGPGATSCDTVVNPGTATATDNCGAVTVTRSPSGNTFPVGTTTITWTATDGAGNTTTATQNVTVIDNTVPVITTNGQTPSMWPPNHKYQTFQLTQFVTGASDNCGGVALGNVVIEKVTSDEIENGNGDGNTTNDIVIAADCKSVQLRSEREGNGNGRVYTITFKVTDTHGNVGRATAKVVVQHNPGETAVDSGVHYTVNSTCQ